MLQDTATGIPAKACHSAIPVESRPLFASLDAYRKGAKPKLHADFQTNEPTASTEKEGL